MRLTILALALSLGACAQTPSRVPEFPYGRATTTKPVEVPVVAPQVAQAPQVEASIPDPLTPECARGAAFARAVAVLRDAGVNSEDVGLIIQAPTEMPQAIIIRDVYANQQLPPAAVHEGSYETCRRMGHTAFVAALLAAEAQRLEALVARQKAEIALIRRTYIDRPAQPPVVTVGADTAEKRNTSRRTRNR